MRLTSPRILSATCLGLFLAAAPLMPQAFAVGNSSIDAFRSKMEKWVETRQILSEERADWLLEKESLQASRDLLRRERDDLKAEIREFEETGAGEGEERRELLLKRAEYQRSAESLKLKVQELEESVLEVAPRLPDPLRDRLDLLLVQIPEDPATTTVPLGQRLINVLGVLAQAEKFNSTATFVGETRAVREGEPKVQVRTLYWGLGQAYFVDAQGRTAGVGRSTPTGWQFTDAKGLESDAQLMLDIYEGNVDTISFIPMPVSID